MAVTKAPTKKMEAPTNGKQAAEKEVKKFLSKGGAPPESEAVRDPNQLRNININLTNAELDAITKIRQAIQPATDINARRSTREKKRLAISQHDWIVLAVQEKIDRDQAVYKSLESEGMFAGKKKSKGVSKH